MRGEAQRSTEGLAVAVIDAGVGNFGNVCRALDRFGADSTITSDPGVVARSRCLVLPGVGAFRPPREALRGDLESALREALGAGAWLLGICVGYQLLFTTGEEYGRTDGLDLLPGVVRQLPATVPLPHIGWNPLLDVADHPLLAGIPAGSHVYFVHSYAPAEVPPDIALAWTLHGARFPAIAGRGRVFGAQFHPEKSGRFGLRLLDNFLRLAAGGEPC